MIKHTRTHRNRSNIVLQLISRFYNIIDRFLASRMPLETTPQNLPKGISIRHGHLLLQKMSFLTTIVWWNCDSQDRWSRKKANEPNKPIQPYTQIFCHFVVLCFLCFAWFVLLWCVFQNDSTSKNVDTVRRPFSLVGLRSICFRNRLEDSLTKTRKDRQHSHHTHKQ